jgi:hypothetical protein
VVICSLFPCCFGFEGPLASGQFGQERSARAALHSFI